MEKAHGSSLAIKSPNLIFSGARLGCTESLFSERTNCFCFEHVLRLALAPLAAVI